jgi:hypothetical protein
VGRARGEGDASGDGLDGLDGYGGLGQRGSKDRDRCRQWQWQWQGRGRGTRGGYLVERGAAQHWVGSRLAKRDKKNRGNNDSPNAQRRDSVVGGGRGVSRFGILGRGPGRSRYRYLAFR